jgi:hypothetical protein
MLFFLPLLFFTVSSGAPAREIRLAWRPTDRIHEKDWVDVRALSKLRVRVAPATDMKSARETIGMNIEKGVERPYTTPDNVARWCTDRLQYVLREFQVNVSDSLPQVVLRVEIGRFYVTEHALYSGTVALKIRAESAQGDPIWEGVAQGHSNRWGRSFSEDNFLECICNSFLEAAYGLLKDRSFIDACDTLRVE